MRSCRQASAVVRHGGGWCRVLELGSSRGAAVSRSHRAAAAVRRRHHQPHHTPTHLVTAYLAGEDGGARAAAGTTRGHDAIKKGAQLSLQAAMWVDTRRHKQHNSTPTSAQQESCAQRVCGVLKLGARCWHCSAACRARGAAGVPTPAAQTRDTSAAACTLPGMHHLASGYCCLQPSLHPPTHTAAADRHRRPPRTTVRTSRVPSGMPPT